MEQNAGSGQPRDLWQILQHIRRLRGYDFSGNRVSMLERRISKRFYSVGIKTYSKYFNFLKDSSSELDLLIDALTINITSFFRDPLAFYYLKKQILTDLIDRWKADQMPIRIWSAGCSSGEEIYSVAILLQEIMKSDKIDLSCLLLGTDIKSKAIQKAQEAVYAKDSLANIPFKILEDYFKCKNDRYHLNDNIKNMVIFSEFDLLDEKHSVPPASVFGDFDLILCRNVLIYFDADYQTRIFEKLRNALNLDGYLMLGEVEIPPAERAAEFHRMNSMCKIYRKIKY